jgi:hypothetical protein
MAEKEALIKELQNELQAARQVNDRISSELEAQTQSAQQLNETLVQLRPTGDADKIAQQRTEIERLQKTTGDLQLEVDTLQRANANLEALSALGAGVASELEATKRDLDDARAEVLKDADTIRKVTEEYKQKTDDLEARAAKAEREKNESIQRERATQEALDTETQSLAAAQNERDRALERLGGLGGIAGSARRELDEARGRLADEEARAEEAESQAAEAARQLASAEEANRQLDERLRELGSGGRKTPRLSGASSPGRSAAYQAQLEPYVIGDAVLDPRDAEDTDRDHLEAAGYARSAEDYVRIETLAVEYVYTGGWASPELVVDDDDNPNRDAIEEQAGRGDAWSGTLNFKWMVYLPREEFMDGIRHVPAVRRSRAVLPSFMAEDDIQPVYIKLMAYPGAGDRSGQDTYRGAFGKIYAIRGLALLSGGFLKTKAEAMRIVRDVSKRAAGIDNETRALIDAAANDIARNASWTLENVRPDAVGAAASLLEAARDMLSIRGDLGKSWRSASTVAMVSRTASTAALDFIHEHVLRGDS